MSRIDPYWVDGNTVWPKFNYFVPYSNERDRNWGSLYDDNYSNLGIVTDLNSVYDGKLIEIIECINVNSVLDYEPGTIRLPDDAARLGLYRTFKAGYLMGFIDPFNSIDPTDPDLREFRAFSGAELIDGFPLKNWDGSELITLTLPNPRIKISITGYGTHGHYVNAVNHAVKGLVKQRLWDNYLASVLVEDAAQAPYPITESKNLGEALKAFEENPLPPLDGGKEKENKPEMLL